MRGLAIAALLATSAPLDAQVTLDGNRLVVPPVTFKPGGTTTVAASDPAIATIARWLAEKTFVTTLRIEGHVAGTKADQALSEARAAAIVARLVAAGVDCNRLLPVGFGNTKPVAASPSPSNTRIDFVNAALRGRLIGGFPADGGGRIAGDACKP